MSSRGVLFALTAEDDATLLAAAGDDDAVIEYVTEVVEERWDRPRLADLDTAWPLVQQCLLSDVITAGIDGNLLGRSIVGGDQLTSGEEYLACHTPAGQVSAVRLALDEVSDEAFASAFAELAARGEDVDSDDSQLFDFVRENFDATRELWRRAAADGSSVLFTADV